RVRKARYRGSSEVLPGAAAVPGLADALLQRRAARALVVVVAPGEHVRALGLGRLDQLVVQGERPQAALGALPVDQADDRGGELRGVGRPGQEARLALRRGDLGDA